MSFPSTSLETLPRLPWTDFRYPLRISQAKRTLYTSVPAACVRRGSNLKAGGWILLSIVLMSLVIVITIRQYGHAPASPASGATPVELRIATAMEEVLLSATAVPLQSLVDNASLTNFNDVSTKLLFPLMTLESEIKLTLLKAFPSALKPGPKAASAKAVAKSRLARVTVYWPGEGDFYTRNRRSSTGTRLRDGDCAVDPKIIPYGSIVTVPGIGELIAVDTGGAVVSRRAARTFGRTQRERAAIVVDVFCSTSAKARKIVRNSQRFAEVTWRAPENASLARN